MADDLVDILKVALAYSASEYEDVWNTFTAVDSKAQGTTAIGGVLVAALVATTARESFSHAARELALVLTGPLFLSLVLVFLSLAASLLALRVRAFSPPYDTEAMLSSVSDLVALDPAERTDEVSHNHYRTFIQRWRDLLEETQPILLRKAEWLHRAQLLLLASALAAGLFVGEMVLYQCG